MNRTFKIIFNHVLGRHVVVSEIASSIQRGARKAVMAVAAGGALAAAALLPMGEAGAISSSYVPSYNSQYGSSGPADYQTDGGHVDVNQIGGYNQQAGSYYNYVYVNDDGTINFYKNENYQQNDISSMVGNVAIGNFSQAGSAADAKMVGFYNSSMTLAYETKPEGATGTWYQTSAPDGKLYWYPSSWNNRTYAYSPTYNYGGTFLEKDGKYYQSRSDFVPELDDQGNWQYDNNGNPIGKTVTKFAEVGEKIWKQNPDNPSGNLLVDYKKVDEYGQPVFDLTAEEIGLDESNPYGYSGGTNNVAVGNRAKTVSHSSVAVGDSSTARGWRSIAIGAESEAGADPETTYVGSWNDGTSAVAVGNSAKAYGSTSVAVGNGAQTYSFSGVAVGNGANASTEYGIAIGDNAKVAYINGAGDIEQQRTAAQSIAIGRDALAQAKDVTAVGRNAQGMMRNATAYGNNAHANGWNSIAIGNKATAGLQAEILNEDGTAKDGAGAIANSAIAVGNRARATSEYATAIGAGTNAEGWHAVAVGDSNQATGRFSTAIGAGWSINHTEGEPDSDDAQDGSDAINTEGTRTYESIGANQAGGDYSTAAGYGNKTVGTQSSAFGKENEVSGVSSLGVGAGNKVGTVAVGDDGILTADQENTVSGYAVGSYNTITGSEGTNAGAFGANNIVAGDNGYAVGNSNNVAETSKQGLAFGNSNSVEGDQGIVIGTNNTVTGSSGNDNGNNDNTTSSDGTTGRETAGNDATGADAGNGNSGGSTATGIQSIAIGSGNTVQGDRAIAIGYGVEVTANDAMAFGTKAKAIVADGVALGSYSIAARAAGGAGAGFDVTTGVNYDGRDKDSPVWTSTLGAVSVGVDKTDGSIGSAAEQTRQITGVAAGTADTDAVNVAQLKLIRSHYYSVNVDTGDSPDGADSNYDNLGATGAGSLAAGFYTIASGDQSVSTGYKAMAASENSTAYGVDSTSVGKGSIAIGHVATSGALVSIDSKDEGTTAATYETKVISVNKPNENGQSEFYVFRNLKKDEDGNTEVVAYNTATGDYYEATPDGKGSYNIGTIRDDITEGGAAEGKKQVNMGGIAMGSYAHAEGDRSLAMGRASGAYGEASSAMGIYANAVGDGDLAIGHGSSTGVKAEIVPSGDEGTSERADGFWTTKISEKDDANNPVSNGATGGIAIGSYAHTEGTRALAVGRVASAYGTNSTAIGLRSSAYGEGSIAFGHGVVAGDKDHPYNEQVKELHDDPDLRNDQGLPYDLDGKDNMGIDPNKVIGAVAMGSYAEATGRGSLSVGRYSKAQSAYSTAMGIRAEVDKTATNAIAIGREATVGEGGENSVAIGKQSTVTGKDSIAIGTGHTVSGSNSGAFGDPTVIDGANSYSVGNNNTISGDDTFVLGNNVKTTASGTVVAGSHDKDNTDTFGQDSVSVGTNATASIQDAVALGSKSIAKRDKANGGAGAGYDVTTGTNYAGEGKDSATWVSTLGAVSVGGTADDTDAAIGTAATATRQITGVAAGTADTDAVNVAQLKVLADKIGTGTTYTANQETKAGETSFTITNKNDPTDTHSMTIKAGDNVSITKDGDTNVAVINATDTTYTVTSEAGEEGSNIVNTYTMEGTNGDKYTFADTDTDTTYTAKAEVEGASSATDAGNGSAVISVTEKGTGEGGADQELASLTVKAGENIAITKGEDGVAVINAVGGGGIAEISFNGDTGETVENPKDLHVVGGATNAEDLTEGNIGVVGTATDKDGKGTLAVKLNKDVNLGDKGSVTTGDTTINNNGVTIKNGGDKGQSIVITKNNVSMGGNQIHNVAPGTADDDAVNVSQLKQSEANFNQSLHHLNGRIGEVAQDANAGIAMALAAASLPQVYLPGKNMMAVAGGTYRGESGYAIGFSSISDDGKWIIKAHASGNSQGHYGAAIGAGYMW